MIAISAVVGLGAVLAASSLLPCPGLHEWGAPPVLWRRPPFLHLTFDDGPDPVRTPYVLDLLRSFHVRSTFFLVGERVTREPELARRIVDEGHEIGNHGWDHTSVAFCSRRRIRQQLERCQDAIQVATGKVAELVRPPYGRRDYRFYDESQRLALTPMFWSVDSGDWLGIGSASITARVLRARAGDIVLCHDGNTRAKGLIGALGAILQYHHARLPSLRR